jgi:hypothetical protein
MRVACGDALDEGPGCSVTSSEANDLLAMLLRPREIFRRFEDDTLGVMLGRGIDEDP